MLLRLAICGVAAGVGLFAADVAEIFAANCVKCHGGERTMASLNLASGEGLGRVVKAGSAADSKLFTLVRDGKMPLGGARLPDDAVDVIRKWIDGGAAFTAHGGAPAAAKKVFWSLKRPVKVAPPAIDGVTNPIDAFVLAKLREKGLEFAPKADERTLVRRLSFDLLGLPPGSFAGLSYKDAVEKMLASHHYGERWGRYWLDVVRYGETDGGEHNHERPNAWRYRDYVIDAFNQDKPYNLFVREQLTGDLMAPTDAKTVAATGFLVAGPWDQVSAELNKDKVMAATQRMDELDDMVTTTFHTFQAMTVNCARCHDHKFDPIPTRDYYRLTSVFRGVGFGNRKVSTAEQDAAWEAASKPVRVKLDGVKKRLGEIEDPVRMRLLTAKYIVFDKQREKEPGRLMLNPVWNRNHFAPVKAKQWRVAVTGISGKTAKVTSLRLGPSGPVVAEWQSPAEKPTDDKPSYIALGEFAGAVSELTWSGGFVTVYRLEASDDGVKWRMVTSSLDHIGRTEQDLPSLSDEELVAALPAALVEERQKLMAEREKLEGELAAIPAPPMVYAARPRTVEPGFVLERGSVTKPKEPALPGALTAVADLKADFALDGETPDAARRMALADWITDERNPLTARVIVNRVWQYHFGQGLVNTPSDFGLNGDRPSHPELLDWLAVSFMENGWSVKWLHRLILSSQTYQQSDKFNQKAHDVDAGNRLLWRMPLRRMDAETLRDSILFVTGSLDEARHTGPSFHLQQMGKRGSYIYAAVKNDGPEVWKRAVYRFVVRGGERIMLDSFDCPDPSVATPQRSVSNTPVQALTLLNNEFVIKQAEILARRVEGLTPEKAIERLYGILFDREPRGTEREIGVKFLKEQPAAVYCRALLNSNEFVYAP